MQISKIVSIFIALALGVQAARSSNFAAPKDEDWKFGVNCKRDLVGDGKDENWRFCIES